MPRGSSWRAQPDSQDSYDPSSEKKKSFSSTIRRTKQQPSATEASTKGKSSANKTEAETKQNAKRRRRTFKEIEHEDLTADRPLYTIPDPPSTPPLSDRTFHPFTRICTEIQIKILCYAATPEHFVPTVWAAGDIEAATLQRYHENYEDGDYTEVPTPGPMKLRWDWIFYLFRTLETRPRTYPSVLASILYVNKSQHGKLTNTSETCTNVMFACRLGRMVGLEVWRQLIRLCGS